MAFGSGALVFAVETWPAHIACAHPGKVWKRVALDPHPASCRRPCRLSLQLQPPARVASVLAPVQRIQVRVRLHARPKSLRLQATQLYGESLFRLAASTSGPESRHMSNSCGVTRASKVRSAPRLRSGLQGMEAQREASMCYANILETPFKSLTLRCLLQNEIALET